MTTTDLALPFDLRRAIAQQLRADATALAGSITDEFLVRHPDWLERYGALARIRGVEDALFHIDFLIGALLSGDPGSFARYSLWTAGVLGSRGISPEFLIENLEQLRDHAIPGLDLEAGGEVARLVNGAVNVLRSTRSTVVEGGEAHPAERAMYLQAALAGDRRAALTIALEALRAGLTVIDVYQDMLQSAQYEIGRLWETNAITVAREHVATAVTQYVIAHLYDHFPAPPLRRGNALVTGVHGELHQLGANMVADVLEADGWNVRFLGTQLPHRDILNAVAEHQPTVIGISATIIANLEPVADLIVALRARFQGRLCIIVGGGAFSSGANTWRELGADGMGRDLLEARQLVRRLTET